METKKLRPTGEEIRKAKKFLKNNNMPTNVIKPHLFAMASKEIKKSYEDTLDTLKVLYRSKYAEANGSDTGRNKKT
jgi:arsenate reductase-like glutaredoxin family protein